VRAETAIQLATGRVPSGVASADIHISPPTLHPLLDTCEVGSLQVVGLPRQGTWIPGCICPPRLPFQGEDSLGPAFGTGGVEDAGLVELAEIAPVDAVAIGVEEAVEGAVAVVVVAYDLIQKLLHLLVSVLPPPLALYR